MPLCCSWPSAGFCCSDILAGRSTSSLEQVAALDPSVPGPTSSASELKDSRTTANPTDAKRDVQLLESPACPRPQPASRGVEPGNATGSLLACGMRPFSSAYSAAIGARSGATEDSLRSSEISDPPARRNYRCTLCETIVVPVAACAGSPAALRAFAPGLG